MNISVRSVAIVGALILSGMSATISAQTTSPPAYYTVDFGTDRSFEAGELNYWDSLEDCGSGASCTSGPLTGNAISSRAEIRNRVDAVAGEALTGVKYQLRKACDAQNVSLPFFADYRFTYSLATDFSAVTGDAVASINLRSQSPAETVLSSAISVDGSGDRDGATSPITLSLELQPVLDSNYTTSIGARSEATVLLASGLGNDFADARSSATLGGLGLRFGDTTPPETSTSISPASGFIDTVAPGFSGWYNATPTITVSAFDPIVQGQNAIAHSCVDYVSVQDTRRVAGEQTLPSIDFGYWQSPSTMQFASGQRYDLRFTAVDNNHTSDPSAALVSFGLDTSGPRTTVTHTPAAGTGRLDWFNKVDNPKFVINCDDSNGVTSGNYSGCRWTNWTRSDGTTGVKRPITLTLNVDPVDAGDVWLRSDSLDRAYNGGPENVSAHLKVDRLPPPVVWNKSTDPSPYSASWWNKSVTMSLECDGINEVPSGCFESLTRLNNTGPYEPITTRTFDKHALYIFNGRAEDVARNFGWRNITVGIDLKLPIAPPDLRVTSPTNNVGGTLYSATIPTWEWNSSSDDGAGVRHYNVYLDGTLVATKFTGDRKYTPSSIQDGLRTLTVSAVDYAGNEGLVSTRSVFVDRILPVSTIVSPVGGMVTLWDGTTHPLTGAAYQDYALFLRGFWLNATTTDGAPSSGTFSTKIVDRSAADVELSCTVSSAAFCGHEVRDTEAGSEGFTHYVAQSRSRDRALNQGTDDMTVLRVDIGLLRQAPAAPGSPAMGLAFWKPHTGTGFESYEIHRGPAENFVPNSGPSLPGAPTTLVETIDDQWQTQWTDENTNGQSWYYKVVVNYNVLGIPLKWVTHETFMPYGNAAVEVSEPVECGTNSCQ